MVSSWQWRLMNSQERSVRPAYWEFSQTASNFTITLGRTMICEEPAVGRIDDHQEGAGQSASHYKTCNARPIKRRFTLTSRHRLGVVVMQQTQPSPLSRSPCQSNRHSHSDLELQVPCRSHRRLWHPGTISGRSL